MLNYSYRTQQLVFVAVVTALSLVFGELAAGLMPLFFLCAEQSCTNGNDGGGFSQGGYSTGGYSTGGYSTGGYSTAGDGTGGYDGGGTGGYGGSTPFLYTWDGQEFKMENDVMFGKPSARMYEIEAGKKIYLDTAITADQYLLKNKLVTHPESKSLKLQIKEIEPEVSAINYLRLSYTELPKGKRIVSRSDFNDTVLYSEKEVQLETQKSRLSAKLNNDADVTEALLEGSAAGNELEMNTGDSLYVELTVSSLKDPYLMLSSYFRDWTMGEVYSEHKTFKLSPYQKISSTTKSFVGKTTLAGLVTMVLGYVGFGVRAGTDDDSILSKSFSLGVKEVNADYVDPYSQGSYYGQGSYKSLKVYYLDADRNEVLHDVIEPRYFQADTVALALPPEAIIDGKAVIRIEATKRHRVSSLALVEREPTSAFEYLELKKAHHHREGKDYVKTLRERNSSFLETFPSDVVTLEFESPKVNDDVDLVYRMEVSGVYAPATKAQQEAMGDWVSRLDSQALDFLSTVYKDNLVRKT